MSRLAFRSAVRRSAIVIAGTALTGTAGCGPSTWKPPQDVFRRYPPRQRRIDLRVALNVPPELRAAKWEKKDCCEMPVGASLAQNAEELARHVFREVILVDDATRAGADATLTPRLAYIVRTVGACGPCESIIALKLEGRLVRSNGQPIRIETVGGQGTGSTGGNPEKVLTLRRNPARDRSRHLHAESVGRGATSPARRSACGRS